jgi:hypothetical protein
MEYVKQKIPFNENLTYCHFLLNYISLNQGSLPSEAWLSKD